MSEVLFDVVFKGRFINTIDKPKAVEHFSKLYKLPIKKAEKFFDGNSRTLKKSISMDKANQYRAALKKAGLRVSLSKIQDTTLQKIEFTLAEPGVILIHKPFTQPRKFDVDQFSLDEVGVTIVEKQPVEVKHYDIDDIHVDDVGSVMAEKKPVSEPEVDISSITMEEVGSIFSEKQDIPEPVINIDDLDMEEVGATIVEKKKIPEPEINIDNISMSD